MVVADVEGGSEGQSSGWKEKTFERSAREERRRCCLTFFFFFWNVRWKFEVGQEKESKRYRRGKGRTRWAPVGWERVERKEREVERNVRGLARDSTDPRTLVG